MPEPIKCACGERFPADEAICPACGKPARSPGRRGRKWGYLTTALALLGVAGLIGSYLYVAGSEESGNIRKRLDYAAAVRALRNIQTAQLQYYSRYGRFASALADLGPTTGQAGPRAAGLLPASLAMGEQTGYRFQVDSRPEGYAVTAVPLEGPSPEAPSLYSDQSLVIRSNPRGPAGPDSSALAE